MIQECKNCLNLETAFLAARRDPHYSLHDTYNLMRELYEQKKLMLYMSDCSFEGFFSEIDLEKQFTYNVYLKCLKCKKIYRLGVCIRGVPLYEILNEAPNKNDFKRLCLRDNKIFYEEKPGKSSHGTINK